MVQQSFDFVDTGRVVNVASVPQRSPFRYPGGKTWLVPTVRKWLLTLPERPEVFVEPFAGGGIISLTVAFERLAERVVMVELDEEVAAVWKVILGGGAKELAKQIVEFELTPASVEAALKDETDDVKHKAFRTILKNRVYHGGIMAPGSSLLKYGENGRGIRSRWYPATLAKRILGIDRVRAKVQFIEGDGLEVLRNMNNDDHAAFFIDPPYTAGGKRAGARLYKHSDLDHAELFKVTASLKGAFLLTYDNTQEITNMAGRHGFESVAVPMKNTHHNVMTELLVGKHLNWL